MCKILWTKDLEDKCLGTAHKIKSVIYELLPWIYTFFECIKILYFAMKSFLFFMFVSFVMSLFYLFTLSFYDRIAL